MSLDDFIGEQMVKPEPDRKQDESRLPASGGEAAGGADLGGLLGALLSGAGAGSAPATAGSETAGGMDLSGLLGGLLGGQTGSGGLDANGLAEQSGLPASLLRAAIPLVIGALLQRAMGQSGAAGSAQPQGLAALLGSLLGGGSSSNAGSLANAQPEGLSTLLGDMLRSGKSIQMGSHETRGLTDQLARQAGVDPSDAEAAIQVILNGLGRAAGAAPVP